MQFYETPKELPYKKRSVDRSLAQVRRQQEAEERVADKLKRLERRTLVWNLRVRGHSLVDIAAMVNDQMGGDTGIKEYTPTFVKADLDAGIEYMTKQMGLGTDAVRELEVARLDELLTFAWQKAERGDPKAIKNALDIMDRRAKLLGLDAARKVSMSVNVRHEIEKMIQEQGLDGEEAANAVREAEKILADMNRN